MAYCSGGVRAVTHSEPLMFGPMTFVLRRIDQPTWVARALSVDPALLVALQRDSGAFWNVTRTESETSIVSSLEDHPSFLSVEGPWSVFRIEGTLDFALTGVLAGFSGILAEANVSVFAVSTFDTDYFLVPAKKTDAAVAAWTNAGIEVRDFQ